MNIRFHIDPKTGEPHIYEHGVIEDEVRQVLARPGDDFPSSGNSRIAYGRTWDGRHLQVVYVRNAPDDMFVVTAYDLKGKTLKAYRRRRRKGK